MPPMTPTATEGNGLMKVIDGQKIHDTTAPMECCDRCRTAELGRRKGRVPTLRYSQTANTGRVRVLRGSETVAVVIRDRAGRWHVSPEEAYREVIPVPRWIEGFGLDGSTRREALDTVLRAYTAAWRQGEVA